MPRTTRRSKHQENPDADVSDDVLEPKSPKTPPKAKTTPDSNELLVRTLQVLMDNMNVSPHVEVQKFDGDPLSYVPFERSFNNAIRKNQSSGSKLNLLVQSCVGAPKQLLQCCLVKDPDKGYDLAWKLLKERYGDDDVISQAWMVKVLDRSRVRDAKQLRSFADDLRTCRETLKEMGYLHELETRASLKQIVDKLSPGDYERWLKRNCEIKEKKSSPTLKDVIDFVDRLAKERSDPVFTPELKSTRELKSQVQEFNRKTNFSTHAEVNERNVECPNCHEAHYLNQCAAFRAMSVKDRHTFVMKERLCVNCFQFGHLARNCTKTWLCDIDGCGKRHNRWLHLPKLEEVERSTSSSGDDHREVTTAATALASTSKIVLPIVPVYAKGAGGEWIVVNALHDNCSNASLCTAGLVKRLGLPAKSTKATFVTVNGKKDNVHCETVDLILKPTCNETERYTMKGVVSRPSLNIGVESAVSSGELRKLNHLKDLEVNEVNLDEVDLLIGQDNPDLLMPLEVRQGSPYAVRTWLGWGISGILPNACRDPIEKRQSYHSHFVECDLNLQVEKFWNLDDHAALKGSAETAYSMSDKKVLKEWEESLDRDNAHYVMNIPFKHRPPCLPDNRSMAEQRLDSLKKRLNRDDQLKERYTKGMNDMTSQGFCEEVPREEIGRDDGAVWYLPHHPVINPKKPDKVRIVFDCAARFQGVALNDRVFQGPDLANKLIGVLIRFRKDPIAFMADIEGMFNQVIVHKQDRDVLRFLWPDDFAEAPKVYRMKTHLFGGVWSPSCANFALRRTAVEYGAMFHPETSETIQNHFYVDDCLKSMPTVESAIQVASEVKKLLNLGGFKLTKFVSNSREVLKIIPESEWCKSLVSLDIDAELPQERALGVTWNVEEDFFTFESVERQAPMTKRGLLSVMSSIYDPLGFLSPFVLQAKRLFQTLCRLKVGWDDTLPTEVEDQWLRWQKDVLTMNQIKIPRCLKTGTGVASQLHIFADASEVGLGAVAYLRVGNEDTDTQCNLVMAKAKLAPIKPATIPRLELAAAVVAVNLNNYLCEYLELAAVETTFWTDSLIVLSYLKNEEKRYHTFVANRVEEIRRLSNIDQWRHVPSALNPADDTSRGMSAEELITSQRWLCGPEFLCQVEEMWPKKPSPEELNPVDDCEVKKEKQIYLSIDQPVEPMDALIAAYSSWNKLKRAIAWILRLKNRLLHRSHQTGLLTVEEVEAAEKVIILHVQRKWLHSSKDIARLCAIRPDVFRVGGRLDHAELPFATRHPMILPKDHPVTALIVRHYHAISGHGGPVRVLADMREKFWPVKGHATVKQVLGRCFKCKKMKAVVLDQKMASLPEDRVTQSSAPFARVGVDYFGPLTVRRGRNVNVKRYGCVFTCLVTRAVHLEVAGSLETDSFLQALQRFIARRGKPELIRSDNGTNFVGAKGELEKTIGAWNQEKIHDSLLQKNIVWKFNPPGASHMGGVWERQIRTIRSLILALETQQKLDDESLSTLFCNIEAIMNGRPLTKLTDDPNDPRPLTPNDLLLLKGNTDLPLGTFTRQDLYRKKWKQVQYLADIFWTRWLKEYLPTLQQRDKWLTPKRNLQKGDLVLVKDQNTPRGLWPLGLVLEPTVGRDDLVRAVRLRTHTGIYERPITKLCLLEAATEDSVP